MSRKCFQTLVLAASGFALTAGGHSIYGSAQDSSVDDGNTFIVQSAQPPGAAEASATLSTNWYPYVIARPADRHWIEATPIDARPNRPLHFYGNAVRSGRLPHGPIGRLVFGQ